MHVRLSWPGHPILTAIQNETVWRHLLPSSALQNPQIKSQSPVSASASLISSVQQQNAFANLLPFTPLPDRIRCGHVLVKLCDSFQDQLQRSAMFTFHNSPFQALGLRLRRITCSLYGGSRVFAMLLPRDPTTSEQYSAVAIIVQTTVMSSSPILICMYIALSVTSCRSGRRYLWNPRSWLKVRRRQD